MVSDEEKQQRRRDNAEDIARHDPSYRQTLSYQRITRRPTHTERSTTPVSNGIRTWHEGMTKEETPFNQLDTGHGSFHESARQGLERVQITEKYNPKGLADAMNGPIEKYPDAYKEASGKAVDARIAERNQGSFRQSAIADMMQAGFIDQRADPVGKDSQGRSIYGDPYLIWTDKARGLGKEGIYDLENKATWGKAFDFYISDEVPFVYQIGEGERKTGFRSSNWGETNPIDPFSFTDSFSQSEGYFPNGGYYPDKNESIAPWDNPPMKGAPPKAESLSFVETPLTQLYNKNVTEEIVAPWRDVERSVGLEIDNPIPFVGPRKIGVATSLPYLFIGGVEGTLKSGVAVANLGVNVGKAYASKGNLTTAEKNIMGSELVASGNYLMTAPITAVFFTASTGANIFRTPAKSIGTSMSSDGWVAIDKVPKSSLIEDIKLDVFKIEFDARMMSGQSVSGMPLPSGVKLANIIPPSGIGSVPTPVISVATLQRATPNIMGPAINFMGAGATSGMFKIKPQEQKSKWLELPTKNILGVGASSSLAKEAIGSFNAYNSAKLTSSLSVKDTLNGANRSSFFENMREADILRSRMNAKPTMFEMAQSAKANRAMANNMQLPKNLLDLGIGQGPGTSTYTWTDIGIGVPEIVVPRIGEIVTPIPKPKPPDPTWEIPPLSFNFGSSSWGRPSKRKRLAPIKVKLGYTPSLAGFDMGIRQKKTKGYFTGFEVRGLTKNMFKGVKL